MYKVWALHCPRVLFFNRGPLIIYLGNVLENPNTGEEPADREPDEDETEEDLVVEEGDEEAEVTTDDESATE